VAIIRGNILAASDVEESQAMGLLQILRSNDASINATWALKHLSCSSPTSSSFFMTPAGKQVTWYVECDQSPRPEEKANVTTLEFNGCTSMVNIRSIYQALDINLVTALMSLTSLRGLNMAFSSGSLPPQLGALSQLERFEVCHSCLQGTLPASIFAGMKRISWFSINKMKTGTEAFDRGCGISGTLPKIKLLGISPRIWSIFEMQNNQLTGQLPPELLSLAGVIDLSGNKFSGSIPGRQKKTNVVADIVDLARNDLTVS
jgi:hypothetical protein